MKEQFLQLLGIRQKELKVTLLLQAYLFIIICVLLLLKPVSNSMLLTEFGVGKLPYVFMGIAIVAFIFTKIFNSLYNKFSLISLQRFFLYSFIISLLIFGLCFYFFPLWKFIIYIFYIWVALFALISTSQFWIFTNVIFNARQAKRIFGLVGAGGIAGGVFGGYLATIVVPFIGNIGITFLSITLLSLTVPIVNILWKGNKNESGNNIIIVKKRKEKIQDFSIRRLSKNKHVILLAILTGLGVIVSKLVDFQFQDFAANKFTDADQLTAFFGFWFSTFNVIGFIIQLLLTGKILKFLGVTRAQFILPSSLLISGFLVLFTPALWSILLMKGADGIFKQSVQRSVNELLILPIAPEIKNQSKTFIDVFVDSFATGISGILLLFIISFPFDIGFYLSVSTIALIFIWLLVSTFMRKEYFQSFKTHFLKSSSKSESTNNNKSIDDLILDVFDKNNELEIISALSGMSEMILSKETVIKLFNHYNPKIKEILFEVRPFNHHASILEVVRNLQYDTNLNVRIEAFIYLLEYDPTYRGDYLIELLARAKKENKPALLLACAVFFRSDIVFNKSQKLRENLYNLTMDNLGNQTTASRDLQFAILKTIASGRYTGMYNYLDQYLESEDSKKALAIKAIGYTLSKRYALKLFLLLKDPKWKQDATQSLKYYDEAIIYIANDIWVNNNVKTETFVLMLEVISHLNSQNAVNYLNIYLNHKNFKIRKEVIWLLNKMKSQAPRLDFKSSSIYKRIIKEVKSIYKLYANYKVLLTQVAADPLPADDKVVGVKKAILKRIKLIIRKRIINIFLLLGLEHNKIDIRDIYNGLISGNKLQKTYAVEFLEMLVDRKYVNLLIPFLEIAFIDKIKLVDLENLNLKEKSVYNVVKSCLAYPDEKLKIMMLQLISLMKDDKLSSIVDKSNPEIRKTIFSRRIKLSKKTIIDRSKQ